MRHQTWHFQRVPITPLRIWYRYRWSVWHHNMTFWKDFITEDVTCPRTQRKWRVSYISFITSFSQQLYIPYYNYLRLVILLYVLIYILLYNIRKHGHWQEHQNACLGTKYEHVRNMIGISQLQLLLRSWMNI